jgi:hypothetical protein
MGMHWLECVIGIAAKVEWNTFVLSVTISHLACFGKAAPKYGVFCVFRQISSLNALITDAVTAKLFWISLDDNELPLLTTFAKSK